MQHHSLPHLFAFVGLTGSGKTTAVEYMADKHIPVIDSRSTGEIISQATHLSEAGQHMVALDDIASYEQYRALKHAFPGKLTTIALLADRTERHQRMSKRAHEPFEPHQVDEKDYLEIERLNKAGAIALANYFVHNDKSPEHLHEQLDDVLRHAGFYE
jgi:dephospho-CoA kinase